MNEVAKGTCEDICINTICHPLNKRLMLSTEDSTTQYKMLSTAYTIKYNQTGRSCTKCCLFKIALLVYTAQNAIYRR